MTVGSFGMILLLSRAGFEAENLEDFRGLNQRSKWFAFVMLRILRGRGPLRTAILIPYGIVTVVAIVCTVAHRFLRWALGAA